MGVPMPRKKKVDTQGVRGSLSHPLYIGLFF